MSYIYILSGIVLKIEKLVPSSTSFLFVKPQLDKGYITPHHIGARIGFAVEGTHGDAMCERFLGGVLCKELTIQLIGRCVKQMPVAEEVAYIVRGCRFVVFFRFVIRPYVVFVDVIVIRIVFVGRA